MKIPILTYHSLHAPGNEYHTNDHIALETDLQLIRELGFSPISLKTITTWLNPEHPYSPPPGRYVGISFDDGCDHDYYEFSHPGIPTLISFYDIIQANNRQHSESEPILATSFVIASPIAREILDKTCIAGRDQWRDNWWKKANNTGVLTIANHSWDHTHPALGFVAQHNQTHGNFHCVDNWHDADMQILQAEWFIRYKLGRPSDGLFAYPYGDSNRFLIEEYFPFHKEIFSGAFSTPGHYVTSNTNSWDIPRFVCGDHWNNSQDLERILLNVTTG